jgi:hypothetical protein
MAGSNAEIAGAFIRGLMLSFFSFATAACEFSLKPEEI